MIVLARQRLFLWAAARHFVGEAIRRNVAPWLLHDTPFRSSLALTAEDRLRLWLAARLRLLLLLWLLEFRRVVRTTGAALPPHLDDVILHFLRILQSTALSLLRVASDCTVAQKLSMACRRLKCGLWPLTPADESRAQLSASAFIRLRRLFSFHAAAPAA